MEAEGVDRFPLDLGFDEESTHLEKCEKCQVLITCLEQVLMMSQLRNIHPRTPTVVLLQHATKAKVVCFFLADCLRDLVSEGFPLGTTWP